MRQGVVVEQPSYLVGDAGSVAWLREESRLAVADDARDTANAGPDCWDARGERLDQADRCPFVVRGEHDDVACRIEVCYIVDES